MGEELRLIEKPKKGLKKLIFSRTGIVLLLLMLSAAFLLLLFTFLAQWMIQILGGVGLFNLYV